MRVSISRTTPIGSIIAVLAVRAGSALAQPEPADAAQQADVEPAPSAAPAPPGVGAAVPETIERRLSTLMARPGGLTSAEAARRAVATSTEVRSRQLDILAAETESDRVVYTSLPRLDLLARYTRLSPVGAQGFGPETGGLVVTSEPAGPLPPGAPLAAIPANALAFPEVLNQYLFQASVTVPLSDYLLSTSSAIEAAGSNVRAASLNREAAKLAVATQAKLSYYEWVRARLQVEVAEKAMEQSAASLATSRTQFAAGRISKADVLNAESVLASSELRAERTRTQAALAEQRLRVLMHDPPNRSYEIGEDLFAAQPQSPTESYPNLLAEAKRKRLELQALDAASRSLSEQEDVADMRGAPKLEAFGNAYYARPNQRFIAVQDEWRATWDVGVQLRWSPNDLGTSASDSRVLSAERAKLLAQREQVFDRVQQEILEAYTSLKEAELGLATALRNLQAAEEAHRVQQLFYEAGRGTTLELLISEARLLQVRIDMVNLRAAKHMAQVALNHAVGRDIGEPPAR